MCAFSPSNPLTLSRSSMACMGLLSVMGRGSEKALEALPAALEAESRNRRPQRQRFLMAGLRGHTELAARASPPSRACWLHELLGSLWANFTFLVFMNHFPSGGV